MEKASDKIYAELQEISDQVRKSFGTLSAAQINWKPGADSWSAGQCFDHLIKSNELYFGDFDRIEKGTYKNSLFQNYSPLSGFFGRFIANALKKDAQKTKTSSQAVPPSELDPGIIEKFIAHQTELMERIKSMEAADWRKIKLTSPFLKIATYSLADSFQIIIEHEKRHFHQAERIRGGDKFPN